MIDNYSRLPIGKYMDILAISKDENLEELEMQVKVLSILSGIEEDEIMHLPIGEYKSMVAKASFLEREDDNRHQIAKAYRIGGMELIPVNDYRKIETCQYVDFQTFAQDIENRMPEFLSVMLVPKGHRYNEGYDVLDVQKVIRENLSVTDSLSLCGFFLTLCRNSIADTLSFCKKMAKGLPREQRKIAREKIRHLQTLLD